MSNLIFDSKDGKMNVTYSDSGLSAIEGIDFDEQFFKVNTISDEYVVDKRVLNDSNVGCILVQKNKEQGFLLIDLLQNIDKYIWLRISIMTYDMDSDVDKLVSEFIL